MQDSEKYQLALASGCEFRDILQQMYVAFTISRGFQTSSEFIQNKQEAAVF